MIPAQPLLAGYIGGWEVVLVITIVLVFVVARHLRPLARGMGKGIDEFRRALDEAIRELREAAGIRRREHTDKSGAPPRNALVLWIAQGFGSGLIPFAPGTFGSVVGIAWFALLVWTESLGLYMAGAIEGIAFSIWLCDDAEKMLGETDPPSIVLDEIVALPFCFLPWVLAEWARAGRAMPPLDIFFNARDWWKILAVFGLFRLFDVWKPWPIRSLQSLPGGWGVTADDLLAAVFTGVASLPFVL